MNNTFQLLKTALSLSLVILILGCNKRFIQDLYCPEEGICSVELLNNKSIVLKKDDIGQFYYQILDNAETSVIKYTYQKPEIKDVLDGNYQEEILIQFDHKKSAIDFTKDEENNFLLYSRQCYCKGQTGIFKMEEGNVSIKNKPKTLYFKVKM